MVQKKYIAKHICMQNDKSGKSSQSLNLSGRYKVIDHCVFHIFEFFKIKKFEMKTKQCQRQIMEGLL
jgi:hypothetical protein